MVLWILIGWTVITPVVVVAGLYATAKMLARRARAGGDSAGAVVVRGVFRETRPDVVLGAARAQAVDASY